MAFFVTALAALSQFLIVSLIAHYCQPEALGHYVLAFAICAPITMFLNFRLRIVLATSSNVEDPTWRLVQLRVAVTSIAWIVTTLAAFALASCDLAAMVSLVALAKSAESVSDICYGGLQRIGKIHLFFQSSFWRSAVMIVIAVLVIPLTGNIVIASTAFALVRLAGCGFDLRRLYQVNPPTLPLPSLLAGENVLRPLLTHGLVALIGSMAYNVPRYFLGAESPRALGFYGAIAYVGLILTLFASALAETFIPGITRRHQPNLRGSGYLYDIGRIYAVVIATGLLLLFFAWWLGPALLRLTFGEAYSSYAPQFCLMVIVGTFGSMIVCQEHVVVAMGEVHAQFRVILVAFVLLVITCATLIPRYGVTGAVAADLVFAVFYLLVVEVLVIKRRWP